MNQICSFFDFYTKKKSYLPQVCTLSCLLWLAASVNVYAQPSRPKAIIEDKTHYSEVFKETRNLRLILPPDYYQHPERRYPVIYYFHGNAGRFNGPAEGEVSRSGEARYYDEFNGNYERCGPDSLDNFATYVANNDVIIAKWDGYVPAQYPRPYDIAPVKEDRQFVDYFPEFVKYVDTHYRTKAYREGRAVSGLSMGGVYVDAGGIQIPAFIVERFVFLSFGLVYGRAESFADLHAVQGNGTEFCGIAHSDASWQ
ncbi:hypothetical protein [Dyadobacter sp. 676]|uniref:Esterase n=1 Tax=Dyadobacter sp. 676 TaxID=3088362 RepID=A0AAU8FIZ1_9BACT